MKLVAIRSVHSQARDRLLEVSRINLLPNARYKRVTELRMVWLRIVVYASQSTRLSSPGTFEASTTVPHNLSPTNNGAGIKRTASVPLSWWARWTCHANGAKLGDTQRNPSSESWRRGKSEITTLPKSRKTQSCDLLGTSVHREGSLRLDDLLRTWQYEH